MNSSILSFIAVALKGAAMGAANVIPGVSGGTVAFITGIYERLINALRSFDMEAIRLALRFKVADFAKHVDLWFLMALGIGAVVSIKTIADVLKWALAHHETLVWAFFFGLIAASIPAVAKQIRRWGPVVIAALVVGLAIAVSMAFLPRAGENTSFFYLMVCGMVAVCSMILPGLSGSFVLLLMGNYELVMIEAVSGLTSDPASAIRILIPVGIGAVIGLIAFSRLLSWLFRNYHDIAVGGITGFIAGSLVIIWPWKNAVTETFVKADGEVKEKIIGFADWHLPSLATAETWISIGLIVVAALLVGLMDRLAPAKTENSEDE